ncbi:thioredoxin family protein [Roseospira marina]|uniref:Thioredoxin family protein n=2 Tax=Roseospira marina TaxID=140057 RepID=A0A5M6IGK3_9PROT|nr:thioredoxin family protein [Roseospira marina]
MFESATCHYCAQWHTDLGPIYPKTAESRTAPLRRVDLQDPWPADLRDLRAVSFTPTFVLVDNGAEVGRITGYAGDEFFWFQLDALLQKLPAPDGGR